MDRRASSLPLRRTAPGGVALALAFGVLIVAVPASGALYKWTDANGRVVYSDQPPPGEVKSEVVRPAPPPANSTAVKDNANRDAELKQRQAQRVEQEKKAEKTRADAAKKEEFCIEARGQLKALETDLPLYKFNEKGEPVYMDDAGRKKEREKLQSRMREHCTG